MMVSMSLKDVKNLTVKEFIKLVRKSGPFEIVVPKNHDEVMLTPLRCNNTYLNCKAR